jgi:hypothetical protein
VAMTQENEVGHPVASSEQSGVAKQKARASINLLLQVGPVINRLWLPRRWSPGGDQ